jgi:hypothetical protein
MNPSAFEDSHAFLDPQQGLSRIDLRQQESGPAAISRMSGKEFTKSGAGRNG